MVPIMATRRTWTQVGSVSDRTKREVLFDQKDRGRSADLIATIIVDGDIRVAGHRKHVADELSAQAQTIAADGNLVARKIEDTLKIHVPPSGDLGRIADVVPGLKDRDSLIL